MLALLMACGRWTRLWPLSRENMPKQFVELWDKVFIQNIVDIYKPLVWESGFYISILKDQISNLKSSLDFDINNDRIIYGDKSANENLSNILISIYSMLKSWVSEKETIIMSWSDIFIKNQSTFLLQLKSAISFVENNNDKILLCWIKPEFASTWFWYIETEIDSIVSWIFNIKSFKEKPDKVLAQKYFESWNYFWNAWVFVFKLWFFWDKCKQLIPEICKNIEESINKWEEFNISEKDDIPVDQAIFEKSNSLVCLWLEGVWWSDVWTFESFYNICKTDEDDNFKKVSWKWEIFTFDSQWNLIISENKNIIVNWVSGLVVVENKWEIFISNMKKSECVKQILSKLPRKIK